MDVPHAARNRRRTGHGRLLPLGLGLCLGVVAPAAAEQTPRAEATAGGAAAPTVEVRIDDGLLTLRAEGAPLAEVLRAVGAAGAFRVVLRGAFAAPVRDSFTGQPVERAVRRLAEGHSLVILHGEAAVPGRGGRAIAEIRVVEQGGRSSAGEPAPAAVAAAVPAEEPAYEARGDPFIDREEFRRQAIPDLVRARTRDDIRLELLLPDRETRVAAVPKVGSLRPHEAVQVLSEVFAAETDPLVRSRAIAAATRLKGHSGTTLLRRRAVDDDDPDLRMQALNALAASADRRVTPVLGRALLQDVEPRVRLTAIQALQRVGGDGARGHIERAVTDPDIGEAAERALATWPEEPRD